MKSFQDLSFSTTIKDLSPQGLGVAPHPDGRIFFIAGTCPGDEINAEILSFKKNYGFAKLLEIIKPSPSRVAPTCGHHGFQSGNCGGCPWMFISDEAQLKYKQNLVASQLKRAQVIDEATKVLPIWGSKKILGYRNRAQFKTDGHVLGFVETGTNNIVDIKECPILTEKNQKKLNELRSLLPEKKWQFNNCKSSLKVTNEKSSRPFTHTKSAWNTIDIDDASVSVTQESIRLNERLPFRQGNDAQNEKMREWLKNKIIKNKSSGTVIELFCGSGNFTEVLSQCDFNKIVAVEVVGESLDILKKKNWPRVEIIEANLFLPESFAMIEKIAADADCLVLDPPREGFHDIDLFLKPLNKIRDIYFISCEITHFSRDAKKIKSLGYSLRELQPLDQFPHTPHIEVLAHFSK
jgi:23S rRNA (uracil1939-C5)-methyltransferase